MRIKTWLICLIIAVTLSVILLLLLAGPGILLSILMQKDIVYEEKERIQSPDGKVDAVLLIRRAGATTRDHYLLYVVPSGVKVSKKDIRKRRYECVFFAEYLRGREIVWLADKLLEIRYEDAESVDCDSSIRPLKSNGRPDQDYIVNIQVKAKETIIEGLVDK